jgi:hypothetical protein
MDKLPILALLNTTIKTFKIGNLYVDATYWQAGIIILLLFLLVFTFARMRYLYVHWSMGKHAFSMLFWGIILTIIIEGFFMLTGRTIFTEILGMKKVPKPFSTVLNIGRERLVNVLGEESAVPDTSASSVLNSDQMYSLYTKMDVTESQKLQNIICKP